jgi:hypothetical protein
LNSNGGENRHTVFLAFLSSVKCRFLPPPLGACKRLSWNIFSICTSVVTQNIWTKKNWLGSISVSSVLYS